MNVREKTLAVWLAEAAKDFGVDGIDLDADLKDIIFPAFVDDLMTIFNYVDSLPDNEDFGMIRGN